MNHVTRMNVAIRFQKGKKTKEKDETSWANELQQRTGYIMRHAALFQNGVRIYIYIPNIWPYNTCWLFCAHSTWISHSANDNMFGEKLQTIVLSLSQMSPWGSFRNYDCGTFTSPRSPSLNPIWKLFSVFSVNAAHAIKEIKSNFSSQCWHLQNNKWEESVIHCTTQHYVRRLVNLYVNKHRVIYPC